MKTLCALCFVLCALCCAAQAPAPVTLNITVDRDRGCAPMIVWFSSHVTGTGTATVRYRWDFGNGRTDHSTEANPATIYLRSGWYTVTLTIYVGSAPFTIRVVKMIYVRSCCCEP